MHLPYPQASMSNSDFVTSSVVTICGFKAMPVSFQLITNKRVFHRALVAPSRRARGSKGMSLRTDKIRDRIVRKFLACTSWLNSLNVR